MLENGMTCRICKILLNDENCAPSFFARKFTICRRCNQEQINIRTRKKRVDVLERLGNKCQCCGNINPQLLSIDHISGGGHKEAATCRGKKYYNLLLNLSEEDLLSKYRCLCYNCNYTRGFFGKCPHEFLPYTGQELLIANRTIKNTHLPPDLHKKRELDVRKIGVIKARLEMVRAYGGKCNNCNEIHPLFMTLDHVNNNGNFEKYKGLDFYKSLKLKGYPGNNTQLQLLCHNCNAHKEYVENRANKNERISLIPEIYIPQPYYISDEQEESLWHQARVIWAQLHPNHGT